MFDVYDPFWVLANTFIKSILLLLVCSLAIWFLQTCVWKRREVNSEYRVWLFLLASMYALPILLLFAPELRIPTSLLSRSQREASLEASVDSNVPAAATVISSLQTNTDLQSSSVSTSPPADATSPLPVSGRATAPNSRASHQPSTEESRHERFGNDLALRAAGTNGPVEPKPASLTQSWFSLKRIALTVWLAGAGLLLTRFLLAWRYVRRLIKNARTISEERLSPAIDTGVPILESESVRSPAVVGCIHHRILLPASWDSWPEEKLRSVFAHELSHIRRRDGLVCVLAEMNTILHWLNPAAWIIKVKLARLAEFACDEDAARSTGDRNRYARHLLEIAGLQHNEPVQAGIAMAGQSEVGMRVERILDRAIPLARSTSKVFILSLILLGTPGLLALAAMRPVEPAQATEEIVETTALDMSGHKWYRTVGERRFLCYRLQVLNRDGSVAKGAQLRVRSKEELKVTPKGDYYEFSYEMRSGFQPGIRAIATSADGELIGHHTGGYDAMTHEAKNGITVTLRPARKMTVQVFDEKEPVANANVGIDWTGGFETFEKTDSHGEAKFRIPAGVKLQQIGAWTSDQRVGGYQFSRKPVRDPNANSHQVELHPCKERSIRIVDKFNKPIPNINFELHVADAENYNFIPLFDRSTFTTDDRGEATCEWFPDWDQMHAYVELEGADGWSKTQDDAFERGVLVSRLERNDKLKRVSVTGRVHLPDGIEHSFLVKLGSFEHPEEGRYDSLHCRTDAQGYFTVDVMPGATYCAFIVDQDFVSSYWADIPFSAETEESKLVELDIIEGEPVEIIATAGPNKTPLAGLDFSLRQGHDFEWVEDDQKQSGSLGRQWWVQTDENGKARTYANPGEISAWASVHDWQPRVESEVIPGEITRLEFHRRSMGKRMVSGVVSAANSDTLLQGLEVHLVPMDGESRDEAAAKVDSSGRFQAEISASIVGAWVYTPDRSKFAATIANDPDNGISLRLEPTTTFRGRYLDSSGEPVVGKWVRMSARFENAELEENSPFAYSGDSLTPCEAVTDANGDFLLTGVPYEMPLALRCEEVTSDPGSDGRSPKDRGRFIGTRYITQGENRPPEIIQAKSQSQAPPSVPSLADYLADKVTDGRLMGAHVLVILQGTGEQAPSFVRRHLYDTDDIPALMSYVPPVWIDVATSLANPERKALFEERDWPIPAQDEVVLYALDSEGKELGHISLNIAEKQSASEAKDFISAHVPRAKDAKKNLRYSLALAKKSGRQVWVRISQTRCGPCYRFAHWIERNRAELEKGFVFLKVDSIIDEYGAEVVQQLIGEKHFGIPYHQILDADGDLVIDSEGPLGNIGHPSTFEDINHLKKMLATYEGFSTETINRLAEDAQISE